MTFPQGAAVAVLLDCLVGDWWLHHGDCIGADAQAHELALDVGLLIAIHPPTVLRHRAFCKGASQLYPEKPYMDRNRDIVDMTSELIAAPATMIEEPRGSGTWATIRYARSMKVPVIIVFPDGTAKCEGSRGGLSKETHR